MPSIEQILQVIVDHPGRTAAEIASEVGLATADVQSRLVKYVDAGKVKKDVKKVDGFRDVFTYWPMQSLIREVDGTKQIVTLARGVRAAPADDDRPDPSFTFGFFSNGTLSIAKGSKDVKLSPAETRRLLAFLDSINIEKITAA
ncbi:hypothetical protein WL21_32635 [Burkholderia ubonensis]|uniref:winged helix-turn-helix domain-containing protein n=1 Tax=Burkholderia ubonensis TaxID=101571 RepID=UPI0007589FFF|nr:winged helix-turn-helix domain-containing protein [Burkholderia ubonensis]KVO95526.1 hypothetical protein WJ81_02625 [Burkholderia ubonensis]KVZ58449.1 hypothetical protein WL20_22280 [Burkholderia ubonensis]KVZ75156.1 hypothetical protein WL21_32635 [Burkholderia ubonensis]